MDRTPRFRRGTSVIAALVFAALLGAVALGLHTIESNSANTAALGAQALVPVTYVGQSATGAGVAAAPANTSTAQAQSDETCHDGQDFNYTVSQQYTGNPADFSAYTPSAPTIQTPQTVQTCPTDQQALEKAQSSPGAVLGTNGQWQNLPAQLTMTPHPTRNAPTCSAGKPNPQPTDASLCTYVKQSDNTYKLKTWNCRVSFYNPAQGISAGDSCWIKDVPVGQGFNSATPAGNPAGTTAPANVSTNGAGNVQTTNCSGSVFNTGGITCTGVDAATAQTQLQQATGQTYNCTGPTGSVTCTASAIPNVSINGTAPGNVSCLNSGTCGDGWCSNGATDAPPNGSCSVCAAGTMMQNGYCQTGTTASPGTGCPAGQTGTAGNCTVIPACQSGSGSCGSCGAGTTWNGIACAPTTPAPQPQPLPQIKAPTIGSPSNASPLSSLLTGLATGLIRGLTPCTAAPQPQPTPYGYGSPYGTTGGYTLVPVQVPNGLGGYTTSYVQQPITTGYPYGTVQPYGTTPCAPNTSALPITAQSAPYGVGTNGTACSAPPAQPQCPAGQGAQPIYGQGNGCVTNFQCVLGANGAQPTPYGVGTNGIACVAPPSPPQCPAGQIAQPMSATNNNCTTGYQCVGGSASGTGGSTFPTQTQPPTAQLSCTPQVADVGQTITISYSCGNSTTSNGSGFATGGQLSGSTSTVIATPPQGYNTADLRITCINNNSQTLGAQTAGASAQCNIQINQPSIVLVANPQAVPSGKTSSIGWVTAGMQSCVVASPGDQNFTSQNASNKSANGMAQTDPITSNTEFDLTCTTLGGQTKSASTTVTVGSSSTSSPGTVTAHSNADGGSVDHGGSITITWHTPTPPTGAAISLWLIDLQTETATALIGDALQPSGSYTWQIPNTGDQCNTSSPQACASNLVAGHSYGIEAALYTPQNAYLGTPPGPSGSVAPTYVAYGYTPTPFKVGQ